MRRNWDTIRTVLLAAEAGISIPNDHEMLFSDVVMTAHLQMAREAKLVLTEGLERRVVLTWAGHELLDAIRDDRVWAVCQRLLEANSGGAPTELLLSAAYFAIRENVEERCGNGEEARSSDQ